MINDRGFTEVVSCKSNIVNKRVLESGAYADSIRGRPRFCLSMGGLAETTPDCYRLSFLKEDYYV